MLYFLLQEQGITVLNQAIVACTEEIERHKGKLTVKEAPRAVSCCDFPDILNNCLFAQSKEKKNTPSIEILDLFYYI